MDGENNGKPLLKWDDLGGVFPLLSETSTSWVTWIQIDEERPLWLGHPRARHEVCLGTIWDRSPFFRNTGVMMNYQPQTWSTLFFQGIPSNLLYICMVSSFHPSKIDNSMTPVGFQHPPDVSHLGHLEGEQPRGLINHGY